MTRRRFRVFTDFRCNNACRFCDQGGQPRDAAPAGALVERVDQAIQRGADNLTFCGGEATLDLDALVAAVRHARERGVTDLALFTNARMLAYPEVARRLIDACILRVDASLHGAEPLAHEWLTRVPGSFRQTVAGIRRVAREGAAVHLHTVVVRSNFRQLPDLLLVARRLRAREAHFRLAVPEGWASEHPTLPSLVPRYPVVVPYLERARAVGRSVGIPVRVHDLPRCQAGPLLDACVGETVQWIGVEASSWPRAGRRQAEACATCPGGLECAGVPEPYLSYYGADEFTAPQADEAAAAAEPPILREASG